ncbi:endonuclease [Acidaminobacter sp. JC074]|uniref:relaxase/mobilization nuclease domain-containing protein n=1 Tax=Acidaminobacter sp. JC074 TaxID=2530199 RepID=UPI001F115B16|nr:relaxase/mobilization nuclease domain-containing protein [Acidaminobacter sp. JC074]MCH4888931.1 endonuclease [Acidaminobacter sp. JC074]
MAITKIHPIKTTLDLSIDYICDSEKTDEEILISSYKCGHKTAALQFANTRELMNSSAKNLGRHLIQSFMPDEVTPSLAHQIGQELCDKHLKGKYEYVITTHVDRGHIHNHIIFNNVSFLDGKAYLSNKKSYHQIRKHSDDLCKLYELSIVDNTKSEVEKNTVKGQSYKEHLERKNGTSYKAKLQYSIDLAIKKARDYDDFLGIMRSYGYTFKQGKHISFKANNQERYTRAKTIGSEYTEERIKERIKKRLKSTISYSSKRLSKNKVIDIKSNKLASQSVGFARWLKLQNLKNMAKTWSTFTNENISDLTSFNETISNVHDEYNLQLSCVKSLELKLINIKEYRKQLDIFNKHLGLYKSYSNAADPELFFQQYERKLILFVAADEYLKLNELCTSISLDNLSNQIGSLLDDLTNAKKILSQQKDKLKEINDLKNNLDLYLDDALALPATSKCKT